MVGHSLGIFGICDFTLPFSGFFFSFPFANEGIPLVFDLTRSTNPDWGLGLFRTYDVRSSALFVSNTRHGERCRINAQEDSDFEQFRF